MIDSHLIENRSERVSGWPYWARKPAKPVVQELGVEVLPGGHEADGDDEEADAEDQEEAADDHGPGLGGALEAAAVHDRHLEPDYLVSSCLDDRINFSQKLSLKLKFCPSYILWLNYNFTKKN